MHLPTIGTVIPRSGKQRLILATAIIAGLFIGWNTRQPQFASNLQRSVTTTVYNFIPW